ncbi:hypothetical protein [Microbispora sp. NPDC049633]|uniref:hypothetical protein n=1 Tax=Microbispora sp. NPDC049633 TaxID=3154355 RepID=UPI0034284F92
MRRSDLTGPHGWAGLLLELERPARPALRVEVAPGRRLAIVQNDEPVLLARVDGHYYGIDYLRTERFRSPLRPLRAGESRRIHDPPGAPAARWAHRFAGELLAAGPLHAGRWTIRTEVRGLDVRPGLVRHEHPEGYLGRFSSGAGEVVPLRELPSPDDGRVKAYRRQARDGTLPPVLLWWISGLTAYVVVDGHDRLVAALAEGEEPPFLVLLRTHDRPLDAEASVREYRRQVTSVEREVVRGTPGAPQALTGLHRTWVRAFDHLANGPAPTRAWPMPGGRTAWTCLAAVFGDRTHPWL